MHPLTAGVQFFLDRWRLPPAMRVMTADPGAVEDVAVGDDPGGLQGLDDFQQRLVRHRPRARPEVRVGENDDMTVNDFGGALALVGP